MLERHHFWGERGRVLEPDPEDERYRACYPVPPRPDKSDPPAGVAQEMIERRHEKRTLDALQDAVRYLHGAREERKAVLAITDGWRLFRPSSALANASDDRTPPRQPLGIDPRTGRITTAAPGLPDGSSELECDRDRIVLAALDNDQQFREMTLEANRANASYYPIDPRGLVPFDEPIARPNGEPAPGLQADRARLQARAESLRALAADTDGMAIVGTNNLAAGFKRIVDDLSSVLPPRLLHDRQARRDVPRDHRAGDSARGPGARATRVPRALGGGGDRGETAGRAAAAAGGGRCGPRARHRARAAQLVRARAHAARAGCLRLEAGPWPGRVGRR